jgi:F-type H+-transporting ATPase subunit epsilon
MKLRIYSLKNVLYQGNAVSLNCATTSGDITVLDNHRPLISVLTESTMTIHNTDGTDNYIPVRSGFLEVKNTNEVRVLVEENQKPEY